MGTQMAQMAQIFQSPAERKEMKEISWGVINDYQPRYDYLCIQNAKEELQIRSGEPRMFVKMTKNCY